MCYLEIFYKFAGYLEIEYTIETIYKQAMLQVIKRTDNNVNNP